MSEELRNLVDLDRVIHEPARLMITAILSAAESADFLYLLKETGLTKGNLSSHLAKLENAGYVLIEKGFVGKIPRTVCRLTKEGQVALERYQERMKAAMSVIAVE